ncbi:MAG: hypothetical protein HYU30_07425 [Chloroflexi bacterium]|nr:hypothetical protein [Chloroflexota bacterium]
MTTEQKLQEVVLSALASTKDGRLKWSPTAETNTFLAVIDNRSLVISRTVPPVVSVTRSVRGFIFVLRVMNNKGFEVASIREEASSEQNPLWQLFEAARNNALNPPKELDELLHALKSR